MTAPLICRVGEALYGPHWVRPLASALGVSERTMRYWQEGVRSPPKGVWEDLAVLCVSHAGALVKIAGELQAANPSDPGG